MLSYTYERRSCSSIRNHVRFLMDPLLGAAKPPEHSFGRAPTTNRVLREGNEFAP